MNGPCPGCGVGEGGYHCGATPKLVMYPAGPLCPVLAQKIDALQRLGETMREEQSHRSVDDGAWQD